MKKKRSEGLPPAAEMLLRWGVGVLLLFAGAGKFMNGYTDFVDGATAGFADNILLPLSLVRGFFYVLPVVEVFLGVFLLSGFYRIGVLLATGFLFILFIFGMLLIGDMNSVHLHFIYLLVIATALSLPGGHLHNLKKGK